MVGAMHSLPIGAVIVVLLFGAALLGLLAARLLPQHHLGAETRTLVSVSTAVVGTLSALVLGLLISAANTSFNAKRQEVTRIASDVVDLDRLLRRYGPEADAARGHLRDYARAKLADLFPAARGKSPVLENPATLASLEAVQDAALALTPADERQRWLRARALDLALSVMATRSELVREDAIRTPFGLLVLVLFWFVIIFASFGLFAPRNATAITAILLCAIGVGAAIRMTTELHIPFQGLIRVSGAPLAHAVAVIER